MPGFEHAEACRRAGEYRVQGRLLDAVAEIRDVIDDHFEHAEVQRETIRLCLLTGEPQQALQVYRRLRTQPRAEDFMEGEFLARLQLELPDAELPELQRADLRYHAAWVRQFLEERADPAGDLVLLHVRLGGRGGNASYRFSGDCSWCAACQETTVDTSFLVDREWICPGCLGRQRLDFDGIQGFLRQRYPHMTRDGVHRWDAEFIRLQQELGSTPVDRGEIPKLGSYLTDQLVYQLSQLFAERLIEEGE